MNDLQRLAWLCADYIASNDNEAEDYERHCEENGLNPEDFQTNARIEGGHIYAVAQEVIAKVKL